MKEKLKQALKFFGISGIGWLLDIISYSLISLIIKPWFANIISSFLAITLVFSVSTKKIFENKGKYSLKLKFIVYIIYQILLVSLSSLIIKLLIGWLNALDILIITKFVKLIAKIIVTPFTMICNYIVMKNLIEKM